MSKVSPAHRVTAAPLDLAVERLGPYLLEAAPLAASLMAKSYTSSFVYCMPHCDAIPLAHLLAPTGCGKYWAELRGNMLSFFAVPDGKTVRFKFISDEDSASDIARAAYHPNPSVQKLMDSEGFTVPPRRLVSAIKQANGNLPALSVSVSNAIAEIMPYGFYPPPLPSNPVQPPPTPYDVCVAVNFTGSNLAFIFLRSKIAANHFVTALRLCQYESAKINHHITLLRLASPEISIPNEVNDGSGSPVSDSLLAWRDVGLSPFKTSYAEQASARISHVGFEGWVRVRCGYSSDWRTFFAVVSNTVPKSGHEAEVDVGNVASFEGDKPSKKGSRFMGIFEKKKDNSKRAVERENSRQMQTQPQQQGKIAFYVDVDAFNANSPIFFVENVTQVLLDYATFINCSNSANNLCEIDINSCPAVSFLDDATIPAVCILGSVVGYSAANLDKMNSKESQKTFFHADPMAFRSDMDYFERLRMGDDPRPMPDCVFLCPTTGGLKRSSPLFQEQYMQRMDSLRWVVATLGAFGLESNLRSKEIALRSGDFGVLPFDGLKIFGKNIAESARASSGVNGHRSKKPEMEYGPLRYAVEAGSSGWGLLYLSTDEVAGLSQAPPEVAWTSKKMFELVLQDKLKTRRDGYLDQWISAVNKGIQARVNVELQEVHEKVHGLIEWLEARQPGSTAGVEFVSKAEVSDSETSSSGDSKSEDQSDSILLSNLRPVGEANTGSATAELLQFADEITSQQKNNQDQKIVTKVSEKESTSGTDDSNNLSSASQILDSAHISDQSSPDDVALNSQNAPVSPRLGAGNEPSAQARMNSPLLQGPEVVKTDLVLVAVPSIQPDGTWAWQYQFASQASVGSNGQLLPANITQPLEKANNASSREDSEDESSDESSENISLADSQKRLSMAKGDERRQSVSSSSSSMATSAVHGAVVANGNVTAKQLNSAFGIKTSPNHTPPTAAPLLQRVPSPIVEGQSTQSNSGSSNSMLKVAAPSDKRRSKLVQVVNGDEDDNNSQKKSEEDDEDEDGSESEESSSSAEEESQSEEGSEDVQPENADTQSVVNQMLVNQMMMQGMPMFPGMILPGMNNFIPSNMGMMPYPNNLPLNMEAMPQMSQYIVEEEEKPFKIYSENSLLAQLPEKNAAGVFLDKSPSRRPAGPLVSLPADVKEAQEKALKQRNYEQAVKSVGLGSGNVDQNAVEQLRQRFEGVHIPGGSRSHGLGSNMAKIQQPLPKPKIEGGLLGEVDKWEKEREAVKKLGNRSSGFFPPTRPVSAMDKFGYSGQNRPMSQYYEQSAYAPVPQQLPPQQMGAPSYMAYNHQLMQQNAGPAYVAPHHSLYMQPQMVQGGPLPPAGYGYSEYGFEPSWEDPNLQMMRQQWLETERGKEMQRMLERNVGESGGPQSKSSNVGGKSSSGKSSKQKAASKTKKSKVDSSESEIEESEESGTESNSSEENSSETEDEDTDSSSDGKSLASRKIQKLSKRQSAVILSIKANSSPHHQKTSDSDSASRASSGGIAVNPATGVPLAVEYAGSAYGQIPRPPHPPQAYMSLNSAQHHGAPGQYPNQNYPFSMQSDPYQAMYPKFPQQGSSEAGSSGGAVRRDLIGERKRPTLPTRNVDEAAAEEEAERKERERERRRRLRRRGVAVEDSTDEENGTAPVPSQEDQPKLPAEVRSPVRARSKERRKSQHEASASPKSRNMSIGRSANEVKSGKGILDPEELENILKRAGKQKAAAKEASEQQSNDSSSEEEIVIVRRKKKSGKKNK
ncbi:hypothetical protein HDU84_002726 [Entophlyctis sp. JEL0112]|nr:hypothetical protein HDU84_002726 [Entophlyctis sp. JEL0112]